MSLFRRERIWWINLWRDGIRHQFSTGTANKRQAEAVLEKYKAELHAKQFAVAEFDPDITFGAIVARFLASGQVSKYHLERLRQLLPYFADIAAARITRSTAADYRAQRRRQKINISDATINRDVAVLRHVLYWAVDEQLLQQNPLARIKLARERRINRRVVSVAEEVQLLHAAPAHLYRIVVAALDTGMRRGELLHQQWEDVDLPRGVLAVTRSKTPEGEKREIPLTKRLLSLLSEQPQDSGAVFTYKGQEINGLKRAWKTALRNAQLRHIRFHDLRHSMNTRLMECGVIADVRMALLGHVGGNSVHARYTHVEIGAKRAAIAKLEAWHDEQQQLLGGDYAQSQGA